jgi:hypothetical protein
MVQALVNIDDEINQALNVVKAKHGLKDKGQAIEFVVRKYLEEPELQLAFIEKIHASEREKSIPVDDFTKRYGI